MLKKRDYTIAEMEIELFALEDVICASDPFNPGDGDDGDEDL